MRQADQSFVHIENVGQSQDLTDTQDKRDLVQNGWSSNIKLQTKYAVTLLLSKVNTQLNSQQLQVSEGRANNLTVDSNMFSS